MFDTTKRGLIRQQKQQQRVLDKAGQLNELNEAVKASKLNDAAVLAHLCQQCPEDVMAPCDISAALDLLGYKETMQALDELVSNTYDPSVNVADIITQLVNKYPQLRGALNKIVRVYSKTDMSPKDNRELVRNLIRKVSQEAWNITKSECRERKRAQAAQMNARLRAQQQHELARDERMRGRALDDDDDGDGAQPENWNELIVKANAAELRQAKRQRVEADVSPLPRASTGCQLGPIMSVTCGGITQEELTPLKDEEDRRMLAGM